MQPADLSPALHGQPPGSLGAEEPRLGPQGVKIRPTLRGQLSGDADNRRPPRSRDESGPVISGVSGPRRLQRAMAVERGGRREAYRRSVSVGPGRGAVD